MPFNTGLCRDSVGPPVPVSLVPSCCRIRNSGAVALSSANVPLHLPETSAVAEATVAQNKITVAGIIAFFMRPPINQKYFIIQSKCMRFQLRMFHGAGAPVL